MRLNRRDWLRSAGAATAMLPWNGLFPLAAQGRSTLTEAARDAWLYGLSLMEMAKSRQEFFNRGKAPGDMLHLTDLTTPATQFVTTPNNDTLYSRSWINLSRGPVTITLPQTGARYASVALMDMYSNNFAVLGTRTTGGDGGTFTLVGPEQAIADPLAIRSPTPWVWLLVRLLVDGDADLAEAQRIQQTFTVAAPPAPPSALTGVVLNAPWDQYLTRLQALILENPPPATDDRLFDRLIPLGLSPRGGFDSARFSPSQAQEIEAGFAEARMQLRSTRRQGRVTDGWAYPKANLGDFGQDYFYRAQVAIGGLAALPNAEAMYMRPVNAEGRIPFDSAQGWLLHLPADKLPPVDAFWSLTMYRVTEDGQFFFFDNPIARYAIGNRTSGLKRGADGSIDIWMTRTDPGDDRRANWLPTPPDGPFGVVFRAYLPQADLIDGAYALPPLQPIEPTGG